MFTMHAIIYFASISVISYRKWGSLSLGEAAAAVSPALLRSASVCAVFLYPPIVMLPGDGLESVWAFTSTQIPS